MAKKVILSLTSIITTILLLLTSFSLNYNDESIIVSSTLSNKVSIPFDILKYFNINNENSTLNQTSNERKYAYIGGTPIGIKIYCDGVIVVGMDYIETVNGKENPAEISGLRLGDVIKEINGNKITSNQLVSDIIQNAQDKELTFLIKRNNTEKTVKFTCVKDINNIYRAGLWIRDSSAGIGTVSFYTESGYFASLGHGICDIDTGEVLPLGAGAVTNASITGIYKGYDGFAGELTGKLVGEEIGTIITNDDIGIYGKINSFIPNEIDKFPIAFTDEIQEGEAEIISTVENNNTKHYDIEITDINYNSAENKNMIIKVTDSDLINKTGGIVQGMSGSPIIQNGKLVGSITHVFVNDSTSGYAIFAETMFNQIESIES